MLTRVVSSRALGVAFSLVEFSCCFCDSASSIGFEFGVVEVGAMSLALGVSCCGAGVLVFCGPLGRRPPADAVSVFCWGCCRVWFIGIIALSEVFCLLMPLLLCVGFLFLKDVGVGVGDSLFIDST